MFKVKKIKDFGMLEANDDDAVLIQKNNGVTGYALLSAIGGGGSVGVNIDGGSPSTVYTAPTLMIDFGGVT